MKRNSLIAVALLITLTLFAVSAAKPAAAMNSEDESPFLHWLWEGDHATMINALLISANDAIVKNNERYVKLYEVYADRDPLLNVYHLRETCDDSVKDAFLVGLKANNLIYLIHTSDDNPKARKAAIKELRLLGKVIHSDIIQKQFPYWAQLLEEGKYPAKTLSHIYVHYTIDIGEYYYNRMGINKRFFFWLGYLVNDFTVAHLCNHKDWLVADQKNLEKLYSIDIYGQLPRFTDKAWYEANSTSLVDDKDALIADAVEKVQAKVDYLKKKYMDRRMKK
ncbi:MAG: hypothetical protein LWY06_20835 [Firmicutes bacterium]|nr:hypothetical protein [Bacillota bacterium]